MFSSRASGSPPRASSRKTRAKLIKDHLQPGKGIRVNPSYLPAPHEVARAFFVAFSTPPYSPHDLWLHQSLWHSIQIIFWGFVTSAVVGVPIGVLCGTFDSCSKFFEPVIDFIRYTPAPAFFGDCVWRCLSAMMGRRLRSSGSGHFFRWFW